MERLAELVLTRRPLLLGLLVLWTLIAAYGVTRLGTDDLPSSIYRTADEDYRRLRELQRIFGSDENDALIVLQAPDFFTPPLAALLADLDRDIEALEGVDFAFGLVDVPTIDTGLRPRPLLPAAADTPAGRAELERARALARQHPLVAGQLLSADGSTSLVVVRLAGDELAVSSMQPVLGSIREVLARLNASGALRARLTGVPPLRTTIFREIRREMVLFPALGCALAVLAGALLFRSPWAVGAILTTTALAALGSAGLMGLLGQPLNLLTSGLPLLVLVVALTDATHLVLDVQRSLREGRSPRAAARHAFATLAGPCLATTLTTAVGFGSLALSRVETVRAFGVLSFLSIGMAFFLVTAVVPLWASYLPEGRPPRGPLLRPRSDGRCARAFRKVLRHARGITWLSLAACLGLGLLALRIEPDNRLTESVPREGEAAQALAHCEQAFGGSLQAAVAVSWPHEPIPDAAERLTVFEEVERVLEEHPFTNAVCSPATLLELLPEAMRPTLDDAGRLPPALVARWYRPEGRLAWVTARVPDAPSREAVAAWKEITRGIQAVAERHPSFELHVSGSGWLVRRNIDWIIEDFARGLALAVVLIFLLLTATFRSPRLGALSLLPNALPLLAAAGLLLVLRVDLQAASVIAFTIALGIAVDDTIHFLSRLRAHTARRTRLVEALESTFLEMVGPLAATTAMVVIGVGVLFFSSVPTTRLFAAITATGVAAALVGDLVVLPSAVLALSRSRARPGGTADSNALD